jgi:phosphoribosylformylglycinamidine cyclo-ligase
VAEDEMHRVFNCGIGMVMALAPEHAERAMTALRAAGETVYEIGVVEAGPAESRKRSSPEHLRSAKG